MTASPTRVLVVGATGRMGAKIVAELHALGAHVVATHREGRADQLDGLRAQGAELRAADLSDAASLERACEGIDVIVSSVQGLRETIVDGQTRLLRAAEKVGVGRMMPSDYSIDFFKTEEGRNRNLDLRREMNRVLDASSVRGTSLLCGAFMDLLLAGAMAPDRQTGIMKVWGDADQKYDFTTTDDVAKYAAAVALDPDAGRIVRVAGDSRSPREIAALFAELWGIPTRIETGGSLADLDRTIEGLRAADEAPANTFPVWQRLQYVRDMASGRGKLDPLDNERYPAIRPTTVRELLHAQAR